MAHSTRSVASWPRRAFSTSSCSTRTRTSAEPGVPGSLSWSRSRLTKCRRAGRPVTASSWACRCSPATCSACAATTSRMRRTVAFMLSVSWRNSGSQRLFSFDEAALSSACACATIAPQRPPPPVQPPGRQAAGDQHQQRQQQPGARADVPQRVVGPAGIRLDFQPADLAPADADERAGRLSGTRNTRLNQAGARPAGAACCSASSDCPSRPCRRRLRKRPRSNCAAATMRSDAGSPPCCDRDQASAATASRLRCSSSRCSA